MSSVVSLMWKDANESPRLTGVHLIAPILCYADFIPQKYAADDRSWNDLHDADILNRPSIDFCLSCYIPNYADRKNPLFSPMLWKGGHMGLPPHYFQVSGWDPARDSALIYERILREESDVPTKLHVYTGQPHGFASVFPRMKASEKFYADAVEAYRWILAQSQ